MDYYDKIRETIGSNHLTIHQWNLILHTMEETRELEGASPLFYWVERMVGVRPDGYTHGEKSLYEIDKTVRGLLGNDTFPAVLQGGSAGWMAEEESTEGTRRVWFSREGSVKIGGVSEPTFPNFWEKGIHKNLGYLWQEATLYDFLSDWRRDERNAFLQCLGGNAP